MAIANVFEGLLLAAAIGAALTLLAFWIWMLVDCLTRESREGNDRVVWVLAIVFTKILGAALYYFLRYRRRDREARLVEHGASLIA